jgi:hypothetical protein
LRCKRAAAEGRATNTNEDVIYVVSPDSFLKLQMNTEYPVIQIFDRLGEQGYVICSLVRKRGHEILERES